MDFYRYKMSRYLKDRIFAPCRGKAALLFRLNDAMAELCYTTEAKDDYDLVIAIGKFQRIFFICDKKIFSIYFPFTVQRPNTIGQPNIFTLAGIEIDNYLLSRLTTIITDNLHEIESNIYEFADSVTTSLAVSPSEGVQTIQEDIWTILRKLLLNEDGYLRYDYDPKNFHELTHPLDHLDIFYSPECTFKVGLNLSVDHHTLIDILDPKTKCRTMTI